MSELAHAYSRSVSDVFRPSPAQFRFLTLHHFHLVEKWRWHWHQTILRATTDRGVTATLSAYEVDELIRECLIEAGMGFTIELTEKGRMEILK